MNRIRFFKRLGFACLLYALFWLCSCAGSSSQSNPASNASNISDSLELLQIEQSFLKLRQDLQEDRYDSVVVAFSRDTQHWLQEIARASRMDRLVEIRDKRFDEVLLIFALRVDRRLNPALDDRPAGLVSRFMLPGSPIRKSLLYSEFAAFSLQNQQGQLGLRSAPRVPVFYFKKEGNRWRLDLARSMPLIMQGAESISRPHGKEKVEQAIWLLRTWGGRQVEKEDYLR